MAQQSEIKNKSSSGLKVQKVKNFDAKDLPKSGPKTSKTTVTKTVERQQPAKAQSKPIQETKEQSFAKQVKTSPVAVDQPKQTKTTPNGQTVTLMGKQGSGVQKFLIATTYVVGLMSVLYFLSSWWYLLGLIGLVFPLAIFLMAKQPAVKQASGRVFFVNLCATRISALFWVLYLTTRRYGIGFLSSMFRALQMIGAFAGAALVVYYLLDFATAGKTSMPWLAKMTQKAEKRVGSMKKAKVK